MSSGGGVKKTSTLSNDQKKLWREIYGQVSPWVGKDIPSYGPTEPWAPGMTQAWTPPPSPEHIAAREQYGTYLTQALQGVDPDKTEAMFRENILPRQQRLFKETVLPGIEEAYGGMGLTASRNRNEALAKSYQDFGEAASGQLGDMILQQQQMAAGMVPEAGKYAESFRLDQALMQDEMNKRFAEFQRTNPYYSPAMQFAMNLMNM